MKDTPQLKSTDYHRVPMRVFNTVMRGANALGLARFSLNRDDLIATARKATGLREFGDERFLEPMQLIIDGLEAEANLNPMGRFMARNNILRLLKHRL
ncbi:MAG TPA: hypothetical protein VIV27_08320, partial [Halioglobus sp.]